MKNKKQIKEDITIAFYMLYIGVMFIILLITLYRPINKVTDMRSVTVTITDKAVKNSNEHGKYLVFGEDENGSVVTYEITDSLFKFRFNSSDVYAGIKIGNSYELTIGGSRNNLLSWYPNIYEYKEVD